MAMMTMIMVMMVMVMFTIIIMMMVAMMVLMMMMLMVMMTVIQHSENSFTTQHKTKDCRECFPDGCDKFDKDLTSADLERFKQCFIDT